MDNTIDLIIVAAGSGSRFKSDMPKQFFTIENKMMVEYTIDQFYPIFHAFEQMILVLPTDYLNPYEAYFTKKYPGLQVIAGGKERLDSVEKGLEKLHATFVLIHDGARPFIEPTYIFEVIENTKKYDAAILAIPVIDTVKSYTKEHVLTTIDRDTLALAQTPQGFHREKLMKAIKNSHTSPTKIFTDESYLFEAMGIYPKIVWGHPNNFKITTQEDLQYAAFLIAQKGFSSW